MHDSFLRTLSIIPQGVIVFNNTPQSEIKFVNPEASQIIDGPNPLMGASLSRQCSGRSLIDSQKSGKKQCLEQTILGKAPTLGFQDKLQ